MFVYTFWEPRNEIPVYLQLCMETWKKFLPNATIVVLDYKNIGEFLDVRELGLNMFCGKLNLALIADAIRVALLAKHGGVWLDVDTIILNSDAERFFLPDEKHRTVFFGELETKGCHIGFINAPPDAVCMNLWREFIRERIWNLNSDTLVEFNFLGNSFINDYVRKYPDEIKILDRRLIIPESESAQDPDCCWSAYLDYYFRQSLHVSDIPADMLYLHNSWTPPAIKKLSVDNFLKMDCTLTNILIELLNITPPPNRLRLTFKKKRAVAPLFFVAENLPAEVLNPVMFVLRVRLIVIDNAKFAVVFAQHVFAVAGRIHPRLHDLFGSRLTARQILADDVASARDEG